LENDSEELSKAQSPIPISKPENNFFEQKRANFKISQNQSQELEDYEEEEIEEQEAEEEDYEEEEIEEQEAEEEEVEEEEVEEEEEEKISLHERSPDFAVKYSERTVEEDTLQQNDNASNEYDTYDVESENQNIRSQLFKKSVISDEKNDRYNNPHSSSGSSSSHRDNLHFYSSHSTNPKNIQQSETNSKPSLLQNSGITDFRGTFNFADGTQEKESAEKKDPTHYSPYYAKSSLEKAKDKLKTLKESYEERKKKREQRLMKRKINLSTGKKNDDSGMLSSERMRSEIVRTTKAIQKETLETEKKIEQQFRSKEKTPRSKFESTIQQKLTEVNIGNPSPRLKIEIESEKKLPQKNIERSSKIEPIETPTSKLSKPVVVEIPLSKSAKRQPLKTIDPPLLDIAKSCKLDAPEMLASKPVQHSASTTKVMIPEAPSNPDPNKEIPLIKTDLLKMESEYNISKEELKDLYLEEMVKRSTSSNKIQEDRFDNKPKRRKRGDRRGGTKSPSVLDKSLEVPPTEEIAVELGKENLVQLSPRKDRDEMRDKVRKMISLKKEIAVERNKMMKEVNQRLVAELKIKLNK